MGVFSEKGRKGKNSKVPTISATIVKKRFFRLTILYTRILLANEFDLRPLHKQSLLASILPFISTVKIGNIKFHYIDIIHSYV
jgi:hypothetical protein